MTNLAHVSTQALLEELARRECGKPKLRVALILAAVCEAWQVPPESVLSSAKTMQVSAARMTAMFLARHLTPLSLPVIASALNRRHHGSVCNALKRVPKLLLNDAFATPFQQACTQLAKSDIFSKTAVRSPLLSPFFPR